MSVRVDVSQHNRDNLPRLHQDKANDRFLYYPRCRTAQVQPLLAVEELYYGVRSPSEVVALSEMEELDSGSLAWLECCEICWAAVARPVQSACS